MNKKHGMCKTPTYRSWKSMRERCLRENHKSFHRYGKLGICPDWIRSFEAFLRDMGARPEGMTLDRIDNAKGYYKENCRWATLSQQSSNRKGFSKQWPKNVGMCKMVRKGKESIMFQVKIVRNKKIIARKAFRNINDAINFRDEVLSNNKDLIEKLTKE